MHSDSEEEYKLLSPVGDDAFDENPGTVTRKRRVTLRDLVLVSQTLILLLVLTAWLWPSRREFNVDVERCQVIYSPAQDAIAYEARLFVGNVWFPNIYNAEPSTQVDEAWADLYNTFGVSQIPQWQADLLPNRTLPIPANPEYSIIQLSVFHQMHCLNTIRKALSPEYYVDPVTGDLGNIKVVNLARHLSHCVDIIRQGLMCAADITPIVWQWDYDGDRAFINMDVAHSCRNYDMVVEWAKDNKIQHHFDWSVHID